jgi:hypothetical protein
MQRPDPESTESIREAVKDMRETLFVVADVANRLNITAGSTDLHSFIQSANYNLGEAQRELAALSSDPVLLRAA